MIEMHDVSFSYGDKRVLQNFCFSASAGQTVCLFGPSGCGKTTVLRLIAGLLTPESGTVSVKGKMSVVFQENRLIPSLTVRENILVVAQTADALRTLGLGDYENAKISDLSGGMARRVAIARAVSYGGDILLLDEPFSGLDAENRRIAADCIRTAFEGKCIVLVSHQPEDIELMHAEILQMKGTENAL